MNYSTAIFLINSHVRAIRVSYEDIDRAHRNDIVFKTLDADIAQHDYVVIPTNTRHGMTVCKVIETDVDIDFDAPDKMDWIIAKVHTAVHEQIIEQEEVAVKAIKSADMNAKRKQLRKDMFTDQMETLKALPLSDLNDNGDSDDTEAP